MTGDNVFMLFTGIVIGAFLCFLFVVMPAVDARVSKQTVIDQGFAYYHPQTGEFTWRQEERPAPGDAR